jgi:hypothetical protein
MFLFYGFYFLLIQSEAYNPIMHILEFFRADSPSDRIVGYYQLMMTQNIPYKGYLSSKWWLMVIATIVTTWLHHLSLFWMANVFNHCRIYNIGVNSQLVLLGHILKRLSI